MIDVVLEVTKEAAMNASRQLPCVTAALMILLFSAAANATQPAAGTQPYAERAAPRQAHATRTDSIATDPFVRALIIGVLASILREAAAQPDPLEALGDAIERKLALALSSPETVRLLEQALRQALQSAPEELREPLAKFGASVLRNLRRQLGGVH
jgi:hypothetical protein